MTLDERDEIDHVSARLGHIAATACMLVGASGVDGQWTAVLAGFEAQLEDLASKLDAVTEPHSGPKARAADARS